MSDSYRSNSTPATTAPGSPGPGDLAMLGVQLERLAREAAGLKQPPAPTHFAIPGDRPGRFALVRPDGTPEFQLVEPAPINLTFTTIASLAEEVRNLVGVGDEVEERPTVVRSDQADGEEVEGVAPAYRFRGPAEAFVHVGLRCPQRLPKQPVGDMEAAGAWLSISVMLDAHHTQPIGRARREHVLSLTVDPLRTLRCLWWLERQRPELTQRELIELLRTELNMGGSAFLRTVRALKVRVGTEAESRMEHQRDSLGGKSDAEIESEMGSIPEEIEIRFPTISPLVVDGTTDGDSPSVIVRCVVVVRPSKGLFLLVPGPGEVEAAARQTERWIGSLLERAANDQPTRSDRLKVFCGFPHGPK